MSRKQLEVTKVITGYSVLNCGQHKQLSHFTVTVKCKSHTNVSPWGLHKSAIFRVKVENVTFRVSQCHLQGVTRSQELELRGSRLLVVRFRDHDMERRYHLGQTAQGCITVFCGETNNCALIINNVLVLFLYVQYFLRYLGRDTDTLSFYNIKARTSVHCDLIIVPLNMNQRKPHFSQIRVFKVFD